MAELIDRDNLREVLAKRVPFAIVTSDDAAFAYGLDAAYCAVMEAPTVDAVPIKNGEWLPSKNGSFRTCSECEGGRLFWESCSYCPTCGARMMTLKQTNIC